MKATGKLRWAQMMINGAPVRVLQQEFETPNPAYRYGDTGVHHTIYVWEDVPTEHALAPGAFHEARKSK